MNTQPDIHDCVIDVPRSPIAAIADTVIVRPNGERRYLTPTHDEILEALWATIGGLTALEVAERLALPVATVRPRLAELRTIKAVKTSGFRKVKMRKHQIWQVVT